MLGDIQRMGRNAELIESKPFRSNDGAGQREKGDPLYAGKSHYVDENKWCKNVRFGLCHYVDENTST
jgi:hypothetical protein